MTQVAAAVAVLTCPHASALQKQPEPPGKGQSSETKWSYPVTNCLVAVGAAKMGLGVTISWASSVGSAHGFDHSSLG